MDRLSSEMGVARDTIRRALRLLEKDGLIRDGGVGKPKILINDATTNPVSKSDTRKLRIMILPDVKMEFFASYLLSNALMLQKELTEAGHQCQFADRSLAEFDNDPARVSVYVAKSVIDVWIVMSATSEVLEWFEKQSFVTIAWGGKHRHLNLPGSRTSLIPAVRDATRHLLSHGHRRIAYLAPLLLRTPTISATGQAFLEELNTRGVAASPAYHLPDFEATPSSIEAALKEMFRVTPPTALIVGTHAYHITVLSFLRENHLRVPEDVSVIAAYMDGKLEWMLPHQAHFRLQMDRIVRRITKCVEDVVRGKRPEGCATYDAAYFPGASVGAVYK